MVDFPLQAQERGSYQPHMKLNLLPVDSGMGDIKWL